MENLFTQCNDARTFSVSNVIQFFFPEISKPYCTTSLQVKVGDKEMDVNKDFRMYITTKLANPAYSPEISARTNIIDFTVTMKGKTNQMSIGREFHFIYRKEFLSLFKKMSSTQAFFL